MKYHTRGAPASASPCACDSSASSTAAFANACPATAALRAPRTSRDGAGDGTMSVCFARAAGDAMAPHEMEVCAARCAPAAGDGGMHNRMGGGGGGGGRRCSAAAARLSPAPRVSCNGRPASRVSCNGRMEGRVSCNGRPASRKSCKRRMEGRISRPPRRGGGGAAAHGGSGRASSSTGAAAMRACARTSTPLVSNKLKHTRAAHRKRFFGAPRGQPRRGRHLPESRGGVHARKELCGRVMRPRSPLATEGRHPALAPAFRSAALVMRPATASSMTPSSKSSSGGSRLPPPKVLRPPAQQHGGSAR